MNETGFIERLYKYLEVRDMHLADVAAECGMSQVELAEEMKKGNEMAIEHIIPFVKTHTDLSVEWLFRGDGCMFSQKIVEQVLQDIIKMEEDVINAKNETIAMLEERIKQLENNR